MNQTYDNPYDDLGLHKKKHELMLGSTWVYQQENMWLRRKVLVRRGSSDFLTLLLRAWRKHCNSRASMFSEISQQTTGHICPLLLHATFLLQQNLPAVETIQNHVLAKARQPYPYV